MGVPLSILEAKSRPIQQPEVVSAKPMVSQRPDRSLPIIQHDVEEKPDPLDVWLADHIEQKIVAKIPQHWVGLILVAVFIKLGADPIYAFVAAVCVGWFKMSARQSLIFYSKQFRPLITAHALGFCSKSERNYRRMVCSRCNLREQKKAGGLNYCAATQKTCKCGHWFLSSLEHRTKLANWGCPVRYFRTEENFPSWMFAIERRRQESEKQNAK